MKRLVMLTVCLVALSFAGNAMATIGWAGNVWPNSGANVVPTDDLNCYVQVWKDGVTNAPGQGADIEVFCDVTTDSGFWTLACTYQGEVGSNDEYTVAIPQAYIVGSGTVQVQFNVHDLTDDTWFTSTNDQAGNPAPQIYNVVDVLPNDIDVKFQICMSGEAYTGGPCVVGSAVEINSWGAGVAMTQIDGDLYEVVVTFLAGHNPSFEYKYQKDGCSAWESVPNRLVTLPTDGTTAVDLPLDSWNNLPMGCGVGEVLAQDTGVTFYICMDGIENTGGVCLIGSTEYLTDWGAGVPMADIGGGYYLVGINFPAGIAVPLPVEFKFKKDGCATWESVGNRLLTVDNDLPSGTEIFVNWDDNTTGSCEVIGTEDSTWGKIKKLHK
ncbi:MAG TPA: hypothetical protein VLA34_14385 [Candidatus Krumholzibacterium sp.]|nr:hypothetical protein [Candidatus Krumholzibacterium sp.]